MRCKKCNSTQIYRRLTTNEMVCRKCGAIESLDKKKEEEDAG